MLVRPSIAVRGLRRPFGVASSQSTHRASFATAASGGAPRPGPLFLEDHPIHVLTDPQTRAALPVFTLSRAKGFLPRDDPLVGLPEAFKPLESLLHRMTLVQEGGGQGLLATGEFGQAVHAELCKIDMANKFAKAVDEAIANGNQDVLSALFRDMCFLTSAYLLEPVDLHFKATGTYCAGRDVLPAAIAVPFTKLAHAVGHFPFMEYASSYALVNWRRDDTNKAITFDNIRLIRAFQDRNPAGSESGFICVHIDMVAHSGKLISSAEDALAACQARDVKGLRAGLQGVYEAYQSINESMETMWGHSKPADYLAFRSFIFGTGPGKKLNAMFPNGVIYEGVSDKPTFFRGESGANDSMIPLGDNLLEITAKLPNNELTEILRDFRTYRPATQREYVASVEHRASAVGIRRFAESDPAALGLYILCVDQIREFRDRHWRFTKQYILERTTYNIATGGSPIATYLPSNLRTVLEMLTASCEALSASALKNSGLTPALQDAVEACRLRGEAQRHVLDREVAKFVSEGEKAKGAAMGVKSSRVALPKAFQDKPLQRGPVGCDGVG